MDTFLQQLVNGLTAGTGNITLTTSAGNVTQAASGNVTATTATGGLELLGAGNYTLANSGNDIKINGEEFMIMREDEVLGILEGAAKPASKVA